MGVYLNRKKPCALNEAVWDVLEDLFEAGDGKKYIFVLDEWDYVFHQEFVTDADKKSYIRFLSNLLKDKPYVSLAYMTGILPIAKYSRRYRNMQQHP